MRCKCPICAYPHPLRSWATTLQINCIRKHEFKLARSKKGQTKRELVLHVACDGHEKGERFPRPDDAEFIKRQG